MFILCTGISGSKTKRTEFKNIIFEIKKSKICIAVCVKVDWENKTSNSSFRTVCKALYLMAFICLKMIINISIVIDGEKYMGKGSFLGDNFASSLSFKQMTCII